MGRKVILEDRRHFRLEREETEVVVVMQRIASTVYKAQTKNPNPVGHADPTSSMPRKEEPQMIKNTGDILDPIGTLRAIA
jgi:hypothetical protein